MPKATKIKTVTTIEAGECRWPIGDPRQADFHFCGAQQELGRPYCKHHVAAAVEAPKPRASASLPSLPVRRAA